MCRLERGKDELSFFEEECRESIWPGYGKSKV